MNDIKVFENSEFGKLEVLWENGKEYFPAKRCAEILGYSICISILVVFKINLSFIILYLETLS